MFLMSIKKILEWDKRNLERLKKFQLKHRYKGVGVVVFLAAILMMVCLKFIDGEPLWIKFVLRNGLIIGLLLISISKEKVEDEMIATVRMQSYAMAFVVGVIYAILQPLINYGVEMLIDPKDASMEMSYFQVLSFMLLIQLMLFHVMIKMCRS